MESLQSPAATVSRLPIDAPEKPRKARSKNKVDHNWSAITYCIPYAQNTGSKEHDQTSAMAIASSILFKVPPDSEKSETASPSERAANHRLSLEIEAISGQIVLIINRGLYIKNSSE